MIKKNFLFNLHLLEETFNFGKKLVLDSSNGVTIGLNDDINIIIQIHYIEKDDFVSISTPICWRIPKNERDASKMFSSLLIGLKNPMRGVGTIMAHPINSMLVLFHTLSMTDAKEDTLAKFLPKFIESVKKWHMLMDESLGKRNQADNSEYIITKTDTSF